MTDILIIAFLCVYVIDYSGFIESMDLILQRRLHNPLLHIPKPFSCSLCSTLWLGLLYLLVTGQFTFPMIAFTAFCSAMTPVILRLLYFIRDFLDKVLEGLETYFNII